MDYSSCHRPRPRREPPPRGRSWCCSFTVPPRSPEIPVHSHPKPSQKSEMLSKPANSFPNSPQSNRLGFVGRIGPRRILSPGRVSPIDSEATVDSIQEIIVSEPSRIPNANAQLRPECSEKLPAPEGSGYSAKEEGSLGIFDVRLNLKGKYGGSLVLELNSEVLSANSSVFANLIADYWKGSSGMAARLCRIEVPEVENLNVFRETIELMFEEDITNRLLKTGVYRSIDILEVSAGIMFARGVLSCLKYLEAVPWSEEEEEKLRSLFNRFKFDDATTRDILARLYSLDLVDSQQNLARQLVWSITTCADANARNELKSLVKGLLCKSSVYEKDYPDLNKEDLYDVCQSCLDSLVSLFEEASGTNSCEKLAKKETGKPLVERISRQVDNINWLLEILLDRQMAEEFVDMWADQGELLRMHGSASPMVRYELSRVSAMLFIAMGTRKLHCRSEARLGILQTWLKPMLLDFGWLQRCRKSLDMRALEEAMGQALLTLPLKQQCELFMEWFRCFSKHGTECPNLSKSFQIWWRRSFLRGSESYAIESR
uniref:BTB domain-containing protein n=1 Tax=Davidia involucrata TaxID=16924 RepID=A0A5B6Z928_DAVIN